MTFANTSLILLSAALIGVVSFTLLAPITAFVSCALGWAMLAVTVSDARHMIIPDVLSLPAIPAGLAALYVLYPSGQAAGLLLIHVAAAAVAGISFYVIARAYERWRGRAGLGLGDVKLIAVAGAWTGPQGVLAVILLACFTALGFALVMSLRKQRALSAQTALPFGAFLAPAIWLVWVLDIAGLWQMPIP